MNILIDLPPNTVNIGGTDYEIDSDFRTSILFELLTQDDSVEVMDKVDLAIRLYFEVMPDENLEDIVKAIVTFYRCGKEDKKVEQEQDEEYDDAGESVQAYSFEHDAEYIYSAFLAQYGVDLSTEKMHWWKFRALFKSLDPDCMFCKIMGYRTMKITNEMSKGEKKFYKQMKKRFALPVSEKVQEEHDALAYALMHGGDVDAILKA